MAQFILTIFLLALAIIGLIYWIKLHQNPVLFLRIDWWLQIILLGATLICIEIGYLAQFPLFNIFAGLLLLGLGFEQWLISNLICLRFAVINPKLKTWRQIYGVVGLFMSVFSIYVFVESSNQPYLEKNLYIFVFALLFIGFFYALVTRQDLAQRKTQAAKI